MAESVDRLQLVTDREQVVALEELEDVELDAVGVLELVDHQQGEALAPARPARRRGGQQVACEELEVGEVEASAAALAGPIGGVEAAQEAFDQRQRVARVMVGARLRVGLEDRKSTRLNSSHANIS